MRGLQTFISDVRKATTKEDEEERINKELAKIREKFKTNSKMKGYDKKKYVCKLLYIYMLGYEIDFGHMEAIELLSSKVYSEKHLGYLAVTLLLDEKNEILTLVTNSIKKDLTQGDELSQCLALTCTANIGGKEFSEALSSDVQKILISGGTKSMVRKKAALTLLRLYRRYPEILPPDEWSSKVVILLESRDLGVITSVLSLLLGLVASNPTAYDGCVVHAIDLLKRLILDKNYNNDYNYYGVPAPWTQVKLFRLLQYYPPPKETLISEIIQRVVQSSNRVKEIERGKTVSKTNATHAVLFEALNVAIHYDNNVGILSEASSLLSKYLADKDTNLRYLALDTMSRLAYSLHEEVISEIRKNQDVIIISLKDKDISIRRRALDLLYSMCNKQNAKAIVRELQIYLPLSDFAIREELVLKMAILAEKFAEDLSWYVDVILGLINHAGDFVPDDIWYRVAQIVTNSKEKDLQKYTAKTVFKAVSSPAAHEAAIKVSGFILGEFCGLIYQEPQSSPLKMFEVLLSKFDTCKLFTKAILFDTFIKFYNVLEDDTLRQRITNVFAEYKDFTDPELQQRANEYYNLIKIGDPRLLASVLKAMPTFSDRESSVMKKILERQSSVTDSQVRQIKHHQVSGNSGANNDTNNKEDDSMDLSANAKVSEVNLLGDLVDSGSNRNKQPPASSNILDDLLSGFGTTNTGMTNSQSNNNGSIDGLFDFSVSKPPQQLPQQQQQQTPVDIFDFGMSGNRQQQQQPNNNIFAGSSLALEASQKAKEKSQTRENSGMGIEEVMEKTKEMDQFNQQRLVQEGSKANFQFLSVNSTGVIIEDETLVISIQTEYHGYVGAVNVSYGNKGGSAITQTRIELEKIPQLRVEQSVLNPIITVGNQIQQYFKVICQSPFDGSLGSSFFFDYEKKSYRFHFNFPIRLHKFVEPLLIANDKAFFAKWNAIQKGPPFELMEKIMPGSGNLLEMSQLKALFSKGFPFAVLDGIDPKPTNIVAAGLLYTATAGNAEVLIRLETNAQVKAYRLTVKTANPVVTKAIFSAISEQLAQ